MDAFIVGFKIEENPLFPVKQQGNTDFSGFILSVFFRIGENIF